MRINRYLGIIVLMVVAGIVPASCGDVSGVALTLAPSTATPLSPVNATATVRRFDVDLGSGWAGDYLATEIPVGAEQIYVHYPQRHITYDEVIVDDVLLGVAFVCYDRPYDVTDMFALLTEPGEMPAHYKSRDIQQREGCHIEFTIKNISGDTIGFSFTSHCSFCYD